MSTIIAPTVETGIPLPKYRRHVEGKLHAIRTTLAGMTAGQSFTWPTNHMVYTAAKQLGVRIITRKLTTGGYRVWRAAEQTQLPGLSKKES